MAQHMHEAQADIMCFQEHNLSTEKHKIKKQLIERTRHHWSISKLILAQSPISYTSNKNMEEQCKLSQEI